VPKAIMTLRSGATVTIEGTPDEVARILELNGRVGAEPDLKPETARSGKLAEKSVARVSIAEIVNVTKSCGEAERIESAVLNKSSQLDRTLLPLYVIHEHFENVTGLTTGEISTFTADLGSPVSGPNVSHTMRGSASKYVMVDTSGPQDGPTKYKINRRGIAYMKALLGHVVEN
jgi:hypothetical protein